MQLTLFDTFTSEIKRYGGDIFLSSEITHIGTTSGKVTGVRTKKGNYFTADRLLNQIQKHTQTTLSPSTALIEPEMSLKPFMVGMTANFDKSLVDSSFDKVLKFIFDDKDTYYIHIKNKRAKLISNAYNQNPDVTIHCPFKLWYNIAFIKPKHFIEVTLLEKITLITFSLYGLLPHP